MRVLLAALLLIASCVTAAAQGCGSTNPNCIVPTAPANTNNNQAASTAFVQQAIGGPAVNVVHGPGSSTTGDIVLWANTLGNLTSDAGGGIPAISVIHPSSGNLVGTGCATSHQAWWADQNVCGTGDAWLLTSSDPSGVNTITVTGSASAGTLTVTLKFSAQTFNVPVTVTNSESTTNIAAAIVTAVQAAGATVYNNVAGAQGQVLYITSGSNLVTYNQNSLVAMTISYTPGTTGLTLTFGVGQSTPSTDYTVTTTLDGNPGLFLQRNTGVAPSAGSNLGAIAFNGTTSSVPAGLTATYASIVAQAQDSTTGALSGRLLITTPNVSGTLNQGVYIGAGLYTVGVGDKGVDTINANQLWVAGSEELSLSGSVFQVQSGNSHALQLIPGNGAASVAQTGVDVGFTINGDVSKNQLLVFSDSSLRWQIYKPASNTDLRFYDGTADRVKFLNGGEVDITAGPLKLGSSGTLGSVTMGNATTGTVTVEPVTGALGSVTMLVPAANDTLVGRATTDTLSNKTLTAPVISGGTIDNAVIGGGTPAAGSFTTLGASSTATLTGQTVHNVATTLASATAATLDDVKVSAATTTITGNTGSPITALSKTHLGQPTLTDSSAVTVTTAATLAIDNAPAQAGSVTITNAYALDVIAGSSLFGGKVFMSGLTAGSGTKALCLNATANEVQTDTSATICGISALRYKNLISEITPEQGLGVLSLRGETYRYKPDADQDDKVHVSLIADDMAALNPACANYSPHGVENYMDRCFEAYQVAYDKKLWQIIGELRNEIADLRRGR